jgi:hypothetical protein
MRRLRYKSSERPDDLQKGREMRTTTDPVVPIPRLDELSPAFQARSHRATARLGVTVNSVHAFAHSAELGGATRDYFE